MVEGYPDELDLYTLRARAALQANRPEVAELDVVEAMARGANHEEARDLLLTAYGRNHALISWPFFLAQRTERLMRREPRRLSTWFYLVAPAIGILFGAGLYCATGALQLSATIGVIFLLVPGLSLLLITRVANLILSIDPLARRAIHRQQSTDAALSLSVFVLLLIPAVLLAIVPSPNALWLSIGMLVPPWTLVLAVATGSERAAGIAWAIIVTASYGFALYFHHVNSTPWGTIIFALPIVIMIGMATWLANLTPRQWWLKQ